MAHEGICEPVALLDALRTYATETTVNKLMPSSPSTPSLSRWRRPPIYAATRLRCAVAMMVFALAVLLAALPSFAEQDRCDRAAADNTCHSSGLLLKR